MARTVFWSFCVQCLAGTLSGYLLREQGGREADGLGEGLPP